MTGGFSFAKKLHSNKKSVSVTVGNSQVTVW
jgi:hypothetical protein